MKKTYKKPLKAYCWECGTRAVFVLKKGNFDPETGKQYIWYEKECPNNRWWKLDHAEDYSFSH